MKLSEISIGTWITLFNEAIAEILVKAGYEWITIDLEHSSISISQAEKLIRIVNMGGAKPLVRVSSNNEVQIKRVLDAGAKGIIVPMVESIQDVKKSISYINYPPIGKRGMGLGRAQGYGEQEEKNRYIKNFSNEVELYIQIESERSLENLDDIFSQKIDGYIIGPYDLSASMGIAGDFKNSKFIEAEKRILEKAKKYDIKRGYHIVEPDLEELDLQISKGYNLIAYSVDFRMLDVIARKPFEYE